MMKLCPDHPSLPSQISFLFLINYTMFLKALRALLLVFTIAGLLGVITACIAQFQVLPNLSGVHFMTVNFPLCLINYRPFVPAPSGKSCHFVQWR
jgi:hypothetical protein